MGKWTMESKDIKLWEKNAPDEDLFSTIGDPNNDGLPTLTPYLLKGEKQKFEAAFYMQPDLHNVKPLETEKPEIDLNGLIEQLQQSPELAQALKNSSISISKYASNMQDGESSKNEKQKTAHLAKSRKTGSPHGPNKVGRVGKRRSKANFAPTWHPLQESNL